MSDTTQSTDLAAAAAPSSEPQTGAPPASQSTAAPAAEPQPSAAPDQPVTPATDPGPTATDPTLTIGYDGTLDLSTIVNELATPGLAGDTLTLTAAAAANGTIFVTKAGDLVYEPVAGGSTTGTPQSIGYDLTSAAAGGSTSGGSPVTVGYTITPASGGDTKAGGTPQTVGYTVGGAGTVPPGFATDAIIYTVTDQLGDTVQGTADITIDPGPIAANGSYVVGHNQTVDLTSYIKSLVTPGLPGDNETILATSVTGGTVRTIYGTGPTTMGASSERIDYTAPSAPTENSGAATGRAVAPYELSYTATDQYGDQSTAQVAITVDPGPTATDPTLTIGNSGSGLGTIDLTQTVGKLATPGLAGDTLTLTAASGGAYGGIVTGSNGDLLYVGKFGPATDQINYTVTDQLGDTVNGVANIRLDPGPTAANGTITVGDGQTTNLESYIQSLVTPGIAGDQETISSISTQSGTVVIKGGIGSPTGAGATQAVDYTAPASGSDKLTYTVTDQSGVQAAGTIGVTVDPGPFVTKATSFVVVGHDQTVDLAGYAQNLLSPGLSGDTVQLVSASAVNGQASIVNTKAGPELDYTAPASGSDIVTFAAVDQFVSSVATLTDGNTTTYVENDGTSAPASGALGIEVDPGPTTATATASVKLGQTLDLTNTILAGDKPGLVGDQLTITADGTLGTLGSVSLVNGDLTYAASGTGLANLAAGGSLADSFTYTVSDQYGDTAVGTVDLAVTNPNTAPTIVDGGPYGGSTIQGVAGPEQINAFGYNNTIYANGGSGTIDAGQGQATIYAGGGNLTLNLSGYYNVVFGGDGADSLSGSQGNSTVTLGNGGDNVELGGYGNVVTLGNGNDTIGAGAGSGTVTVGNGNDSITAAGYSNVFAVGSGNDQIVAGAGNATITGGGGSDIVQLQGNGNSVSLTGGNNTITGGQGSDTFDLTGGTSSLTLAGSNEMAFLNGANATINDLGSGLDVKIANGGNDVIQNFASDPSAFIDLVGGIGGYSAFSQVLAALTPDGHGGSMLALGGAGSIDFVGVNPSQLHASNFHFN